MLELKEAFDNFAEAYLVNSGVKPAREHLRKKVCETFGPLSLEAETLRSGTDQQCIIVMNEVIK